MKGCKSIQVAQYGKVFLDARCMFVKIDRNRQEIGDTFKFLCSSSRNPECLLLLLLLHKIRVTSYAHAAVKDALTQRRVGTADSVT